MTFHITLIFFYFFFTMRTGPVFRLDAKWQPERFSPWAVLTSSENLNPVLMTVSHCPVLTENWTENRRRFSAGEWELPKTGVNPTDQINSQLNKIVQVNPKIM
jgi:hypothetical protein